MSNQLTIQLLPKLPQSEFAKRRAKLAEALPNNSIAILQTAPAHIRNNDAEYKYRADSSFFYLTGFAEPESVMVLEKTDHTVNYTLFLREKTNYVRFGMVNGWDLTVRPQILARIKRLPLAELMR